MLNKNDPLIGAVQEVMKKNQAERDAVRLVNEKFGVTDRKALPHERQGEWDAAYKTVLTEGVEALDEAKKKSKLHPGLNTPESMKIRKIAGPGKVQYDPNDGVHIHDNLSDSIRKIRGFIVKDGKVKEIKGFVPGMREGVEILNELSPETLENYKNKRKTQVHAIIRNMKDWQLKKTPQGASDFIINSAEKAAKHAKMIKLAGDKIEGKKGVVPAKRPKKDVVPANRPKKRLEEEALDEEKIKMYGIPNKVKPKRGRLGRKDKNAIDVTNNLFWRMKELEKGNVKAAGNVTRAQIEKMQSEENDIDHPNKRKLDVAEPFGDLTSADFKKLRSMKESDVTSPSSMGIKKPDYAPAGTTPDYAKSKEQTVNRAAKTSLPPGTMKEENLEEAGMMPKGIIAKKLLKLKATMKSRAAEKRAWDDRGWGPGPDFRKDVDTMQRMDKVAKRLEEKKLTSAEKSKREKVATAMERENPGMPMAKKMRIATETAKRVAEENEGFNNRHGLSVTASAEKQVVAEVSDIVTARGGHGHVPFNTDRSSGFKSSNIKSSSVNSSVKPSELKKTVQRARSDYGLGSIPAQKNAAQRRAELDARMEKGIDTVAPFVPGVGAARAIDKYARGQQGLGQTAADVGMNLAGGALVGGAVKASKAAYNFIKGGRTAGSVGQKLLPRPVSSATAKVASKPAKPVSQAAREPDEIIMPAKKPDIPSGNAGIRGTFQDKLARARQNAGSDLKARQLPALRRTTEPTNYVRPGVPAVRPTSGPNLPARPGSPNLAAGGATRIVGLSDKAKAGLAAGAAGAAIGGYALNRSLSGNQPPAAQASTTPVAPANAASPQAMSAGAERDKVGVKRIQPVTATTQSVPVPKPKPVQTQAQPQVTKKSNALQQQMARSKSGRDEPAGPRKDAQGLNVHSMTRPQPGKPGVRK
jgi:hypothetical protein